jgi:hypothetical protein
LNKGKDIPCLGALETFILIVFDGKTIMPFAKRTLLKMIPLHFEARLLNDYLLQIDTVFYFLKVRQSIPFNYLDVFSLTYLENVLKVLLKTLQKIFKILTSPSFSAVFFKEVLIISIADFVIFPPLLNF